MQHLRKINAVFNAVLHLKTHSIAFRHEKKPLDIFFFFVNNMR